MIGAIQVASHVPGRLRLRGPGLAGHQRNQTAQEDIQGWEGILLVEGNPATGSLLLRYDGAKITPDALERQLSAQFKAMIGTIPPALPQPPALRRINRPVKIGMLVSMAASLLALTKGKTLHASLGMAHLVFLTLHLLHHQKTLVR